MLRTPVLRKTHRTLGVIIGVQLLLWTLSGAFFVWADLDEVHGDPERAAVEAIEPGQDWVSPSAVPLDKGIEALSLVRIGSDILYQFRLSDSSVVLANVETGEVRGPLTETEAVALAEQSFAPDSSIKRVTRITEAGPHHEYRGGDLPAWVVEFDHRSGTRVYVAETTGEVAKFRNTIWRVFDFLWMLHTMDYLGRDDFNNPLVRTVAVLAILTVLSGFLMWTRTRTPRKRRNPNPAA